MAGGFDVPGVIEVRRPDSKVPANKLARWTLSDPPEIGSWPPLPNVPQDVQAAAQKLAGVAASTRVDPGAADGPPSAVDDDLLPTEPPRVSGAAAKMAGAIWDATPPIAGVSNLPAHRSAPVEPDLVTAPVPATSSAPAPAQTSEPPLAPGARDFLDSDTDEITAIKRSDSVEASVPTERPPPLEGEASTAAKILGSILPLRKKRSLPIEPEGALVPLRDGEDLSAAGSARPAQVVADELPASGRASVAGGDQPTPLELGQAGPGTLTVTNAGYMDSSVARFEGLVERGAWDQLDRELMVAPNPSPTLRLLHVLARRETAPTEDKGSSAKLTKGAILTLAELLGVPPDSPTALLFAKRLLRRNPVSTNQQPPASKSVGIIVGGLLVGAGIGWLVTKILL